MSGLIQTLKQADIPAPWHHLNKLLLEIGRVVPIRSYDESYVSIHTPDVLAMIKQGDPAWESLTPAVVVEMIKAKHLFGWQTKGASLLK